ncbi:MAG: S8 family serine peptidase [Deltaproteobacteria bacterium]|nr:S8 family serine peptidase [Deltaproteobacteria bacterium]
MRKDLSRAARVMGLAACVLLISVAAFAQTAPSVNVIPGQYIVTLNPQVKDSVDFAVARGISPKNAYNHALKGFAARLTAAQLRLLERDKDVVAIEPDTIVRANAQTVPTGIKRSYFDLLLNGTTVNADIAIIDTGIQLNHPDLTVVKGVDCRTLDRKTKDCKIGGADDNGHGTHVAGSAAAIDNGVGVVGTAPGARLHAVKVLDRNGSGTTSGVIQGIDWVKRNAATIEVANMSLGGSGSDDRDGQSCSTSTNSYHKAICSAVGAGVTFVVAAGNEKKDAGLSLPAAYDEVITVSALADFDGLEGRLGTGNFAFSSCTESVDDSFACFSNYGHDVDIMAPGVGIYSTYKGSSYATMSGTSMASPHVAGAAARVKAANPGFTPAQVKAALVAAGDPLPCDASPSSCSDDPDGVQEPLLQP